MKADAAPLVQDEEPELAVSGHSTEDIVVGVVGGEEIFISMMVGYMLC